VSGALEGLESVGRPLGLLPGGGYEERHVDLHEGDSLILFTDGVVEAEDEAGEPFGERLSSLLVEQRTKGVDEILTNVAHAVQAHLGSSEPADDATMVVLRIGDAKTDA